MGDIANSPGQQALASMKEISKDLVFKKPIGIPKRRKIQTVLDEDSYVEVHCIFLLKLSFLIHISTFQELGKIIQRDFFPDLEKLQAQNEYLEAMERNDVMKLRELYAKYSGPRRPTQRSMYSSYF